MKTEVLLEPISDNRYCASGSGVFSTLIGEGASRDEALQNLQAAIRKKLRAAEITSVLLCWHRER